MKTLFIFASFAVIVVCAHAEFVVAPNDRAMQSGDAFSFDGFDGPSRVQSVYGARNFTGPVLIHGIAFRADETGNGLSFSAQIPRITIRMSTYFGSFESFKSTYDENKGSDDVTVFNAAVNWMTTDLAGAGPNPFDLTIPFSRPFAYDPSKGALLINYESFGPVSGGVIVDAHSHRDASIGWITGFGGHGTGNLVTRFEITPIPEPTTATLLLCTTLGVLAWRSRT